MRLAMNAAPTAAFPVVQIFYFDPFELTPAATGLTRFGGGSL
jgi:hypothetical protein